MPNYSLHDQYDFIVTDIAYIVEKQPNPIWKLSKQNRVNDYILRFSTEGEAICYIENKPQKVKRGDLLFYQKNATQQSHSDYNNPWTFFSAAFDMEFLNPACSEIFNHLPTLIHCTNMHKISVLFSELNQAWLGKEIGHLVKCRSILMELLYLMIMEIRMATNINPHHLKIKKVLSEIQANYANSYSVDELAEIAGLSSSYFRVLFKKTTGLTTVQYQNNIKISKAKDFLLSGNYNVSEAADSVGFCNVYYFSELFKKITGISPIKYMKGN